MTERPPTQRWQTKNPYVKRRTADTGRCANAAPLQEANVAPPTPPVDVQAIGNAPPAPPTLPDVEVEVAAVSWNSDSEGSMGGQSQNRSTFRARLSQNRNKRRKHFHVRPDEDERRQVQPTLYGQVFNPEKDCKTCAQQANWRKYPVGHHCRVVECKKKHHKFCHLNSDNRPRDVETEYLKSIKTKPLKDKEKFSSRHISAEAFGAFFDSRRPKHPPAARKKPPPASSMERSQGTPATPAVMAESKPDYLCPSHDNTLLGELASYVEKMVCDETFLQQHSKKAGAPLPMAAVAKWLLERKPRKASVATADKFAELYAVIPQNTISLRIPETSSCKQVALKPHYYSIMAQTLHHVDWMVHFPHLSLVCPGGCKDVWQTGIKLKYDCTNYSSNKSLFPIWHMSGAPHWCVLVTYQCPCCNAKWKSNDATVLLQLPPHIRHCYPVDTKYCFGATHFHRDTTLTFEENLLTYSNGDHLARCISASINHDWKRRQANYLSIWD